MKTLLTIKVIRTRSKSATATLRGNVLTINKTWWATLCLPERCAVLAHETSHWLLSGWDSKLPRNWNKLV